MYWRRPRASRPTAWMWPSGNGQIQTSVQAGGMTRDWMRARVSESLTCRPVEPRESQPVPARERAAVAPVAEALGCHLLEGEDDLGRTLGIEAGGSGVMGDACPDVAELAHGEGELLEARWRVGECRLVRPGRLSRQSPTH